MDIVIKMMEESIQMALLMDSVYMCVCVCVCVCTVCMHVYCVCVCVCVCVCAWLCVYGYICVYYVVYLAGWGQVTIMIMVIVNWVIWWTLS